MPQRTKRRSHHSSGAAAGLTGPATGSSLHSVQSVDSHPPEGGSIWNRRRVLLLNSTYEPLTALPVRRAIIMLICGKADVVHDDPSGPRDPLGDQIDRGAVGDPVACLCPGALPGPRPDDPRGADAPRPLLLRLLRRQGRHRRPCGAPQPRRRSFVGELRGVLLDLQPPQGRQAADRAGLVAAPGTDVAEGSALAVAVDDQRSRPGVGAIPRRRRGLARRRCGPRSGTLWGYRPAAERRGGEAGNRL